MAHVLCLQFPASMLSLSVASGGLASISNRELGSRCSENTALQASGQIFKGAMQAEGRGHRWPLPPTELHEVFTCTSQDLKCSDLSDSPHASRIPALQQHGLVFLHPDVRLKEFLDGMRFHLSSPWKIEPLLVVGITGKVIFAWIRH